MNIKKIGCFGLAWFASVAVATCFAINSVLAQQLLPPPPVLGTIDPALSRLEIKLDDVIRRQQQELRILKAIHVKLFPLKLEQSTLDAAIDGQ